jgi:hypothetical protein
MMGADTLAARIAALGAPVVPPSPASPSTEPASADATPTIEPAPETPAATATAPAPTAPVTTETTTTEIVVKGLGSFGAITGFRQALSGVDGIDAVALSLGQTGEFIFRASHRAGVDLPAAISQLEGDGAKIESRPEGGYVVTLDRAR